MPRESTPKSELIRRQFRQTPYGRPSYKLRVSGGEKTVELEGNFQAEDVTEAIRKVKNANMTNKTNEVLMEVHPVLKRNTVPPSHFRRIAEQQPEDSERGSVEYFARLRDAALVKRCANCRSDQHLADTCIWAPKGTISVCPMCPNNKTHTADKCATFYNATLEQKVQVLVVDRGNMPAYTTKVHWYDYLDEYRKQGGNMPDRFPWSPEFARGVSEAMTKGLQALLDAAPQGQTPPLPRDEATKDWVSVVAWQESLATSTTTRQDDPRAPPQGGPSIQEPPREQLSGRVGQHNGRVIRRVVVQGSFGGRTIL